MANGVHAPRSSCSPRSRPGRPTSRRGGRAAKCRRETQPQSNASDVVARKFMVRCNRWRAPTPHIMLQPPIGGRDAGGRKSAHDQSCIDAAARRGMQNGETGGRAGQRAKQNAECAAGSRRSAHVRSWLHQPYGAVEKAQSEANGGEPAGLRTTRLRTSSGGAASTSLVPLRAAGSLGPFARALARPRRLVVDEGLPLRVRWAAVG